jgi:hypothetical protein
MFAGQVFLREHAFRKWCGAIPIALAFVRSASEEKPHFPSEAARPHESALDVSTPPPNSESVSLYVSMRYTENKAEGVSTTPANEFQIVRSSCR